MKIIVLISANTEWRSMRRMYPEIDNQPTPYGESFETELEGRRFHFMFGGWGKISAAASTQYAIDRWQPDLLINLGTCGGFEGHVARGTILLVTRTLVYDIIEQMGDFDEHIAHYSTTLDLNWLKPPYPLAVQPALLISADRDLVAAELPDLHRRYQAIAGDWESGAIAWVAQRSATRLLILRGVTDLVGASGGEAYGNQALFEQATDQMLPRLVNSLPAWVAGVDLTSNQKN